jgi:hypothetical protein
LELLLSGQSPRWFPFTLDVGAINGLGPIMQLFHEKTGKADPAEFFDHDFRCCSLTAHFGGDDPRSLRRHVEPGTRFDEWGIGHLAAGAEGTPDRTFPPLADAGSVRDVEEMTAMVRQLAGLCKAGRKRHHQWLQVWDVRKGNEHRILEQGRILIREKPDALYLWAYAAQIGTTEACDDPKRAWANGRRILRLATGL